MKTCRLYAPFLLFAWIGVALLSGIPGEIRAQDDSFPLPGSLIDPGVWDRPDFVAAWGSSKSPGKIAHRIWPQTPVIFGQRPHYVSGHFIGKQMDSITLLFLDSGTHFGYVAKDKAAANEKMNRESFQALHAETAEKVLRGLEKLSGSKGEAITLGQTPMLKQNVILFSSGKLTARYFSIPEQLVKVTFFRDEKKARSLMLYPTSKEMKRRERAEQFHGRIHEAKNGDHLLENIPLFPQGDRAYCGVSVLSMSMQYLGLNLDTEDYAAAAGIRYGSTKGSKIREVYKAAGEENNMRMSRSTKFDFRKAQATLNAGLPVIVWRYWMQERDYVHTTFAARFAKDPMVELPKADMNDRETWPQRKKSFSHASVITGYNAERGEVIFTESWSEGVRNRRMRYEEMEGTAYYSFYPSL